MPSQNRCHAHLFSYTMYTMMIIHFGFNAMSCRMYMATPMALSCISHMIFSISLLIIFLLNIGHEIWHFFQFVRWHSTSFGQKYDHKNVDEAKQIHHFPKQKNPFFIISAYLNKFFYLIWGF